ncbi:arrestin domain-containing protein 2-like [Hetaerina americana]|uniref:arrestin domain-containing protein 2-like n=1 Tax=Hetaerina americana TaxID=62018 RepID=UPI003A7F2712
MDYIREFDIRLEREMYYAGETLAGHVVLDTVENFKLRAVRVVLRGKAHAEWKVVVSGDRRTVKDDQYFIDDRTIIWGKDKPEGNVPILPRGLHKFPFKFQLPESSLPSSFESKPGYIRYYIKVTVDIPYASPPQGMKYFTIIGPHIDCMDEQYLKPMVGHDKRTTCCLCCEKGPVVLRAKLERSAYVCGESIKLRADVDNQGEEEVRLKVKLLQFVEFFVERGVLGVGKELERLSLEYRGEPVVPGTRAVWDSAPHLIVPIMPPTLLGVCRLMQIYYVLKVNLEFEKSGEDLHMHFPVTIATVPFRIPNSKQQPTITYETASEHVEGGSYIGPEFLLGQVYDGGQHDGSRDTVVLYRPVYVCVVRSQTTPNQKEHQMIPSVKHKSPHASRGTKVSLPDGESARGDTSNSGKGTEKGSKHGNAAATSCNTAVKGDDNTPLDDEDREVGEISARLIDCSVDGEKQSLRKVAL